MRAGFPCRKSPSSCILIYRQPLEQPSAPMAGEKGQAGPISPCPEPRLQFGGTQSLVLSPLSNPHRPGGIPQVRLPQCSTGRHQLSSPAAPEQQSQGWEQLRRKVWSWQRCWQGSAFLPAAQRTAQPIPPLPQSCQGRSPAQGTNSHGTGAWQHLKIFSFLPSQEFPPHLDVEFPRVSKTFHTGMECQDTGQG